MIAGVRVYCTHFSNIIVMTVREGKVLGRDVVLQVGIPENPHHLSRVCSVQTGEPSPEVDHTGTGLSDFQPPELRDKNLSPKPEVRAPLQPGLNKKTKRAGVGVVESPLRLSILKTEGMSSSPLSSVAQLLV